MDKNILKGIKRDVARGTKRVGDTARWLLDFAYRDLSKLDQDDAIDTGREILAFAATEWKPLKEYSDSDFSDVHLLSLFEMLKASGGFLANGLAVSFQHELRNRFEDCKLGRWWEYKPPAPVERFTVFKVASHDESGHSMRYADHASDTNESLFDILLGTATKVVKRERERFALCNNRLRCGQPFVGERKRRGKYCSPKCSAYVRVMKKRGKL